MEQDIRAGDVKGQQQPKEINMASIIQNVDAILRKEGLAQCLRKAAEAVDEAKEGKK